MTDNASGPEWLDADSGPNYQHNDTADAQNPQDTRNTLPSVRSSIGAWNRTPTSRQAGWCMRFRLRLVKKTTGELSSIQKPCGSWTHQACAERKAEKAIEAFLRHWEGLDVVYFVSVPTNPSTFDRLRKRRQGKVVQWVTVRRTDGTTHLYSSRFLPGPECPETWVEINPEAGLQLFAGQSVALPGVDRLSSKPSWQPVSVHVSGVNVSLGGVPDAIWERAVDAAADRLRVEFGTQVEPGEPLPPEVPVQDWIDVLAEEIEREREAHAHPLVPPEPHVYSYQEEED